VQRRGISILAGADLEPSGPQFQLRLLVALHRISNFAAVLVNLVATA
jgi:hypothetical protein